jgi:hypothetical protein
MGSRVIVHSVKNSSSIKLYHLGECCILETWDPKSFLVISDFKVLQTIVVAILDAPISSHAEIIGSRFLNEATRVYSLDIVNAFTGALESATNAAKLIFDAAKKESDWLVSCIELSNGFSAMMLDRTLLGFHIPNEIDCETDVSLYYSTLPKDENLRAYLRSIGLDFDDC